MGKKFLQIQEMLLLEQLDNWILRLFQKEDLTAISIIWSMRKIMELKHIWKVLNLLKKWDLRRLESLKNILILKLLKNLLKNGEQKEKNWIMKPTGWL